MAIEATGQETTRSAQPDQDQRLWEGLGFRMEAVPGAPPAAAAQPGQGAPPTNGQQPTPDGFRGMFSDISDEQWPTVEPHLRNVQAHVTRLEQIAKPFTEAGVNPDQATQLLQFAQNYSNDPVGTWLAMAATLNEAGALPEDLDFDELNSIVTGEPNPNATPEQPAPGEVPGDPNVAQLMQQVKEQGELIKSLVDDRTQERTQRQTDQQNALLAKTVDQVKTQLKDAGVPEPAEELIVASIIANKGQPNAVVEQLTGLKASVLQGITTNRETNGQPPRQPRGVPPTTPKPRTGGRPDAFKSAREGATQFLKQQNEGAAQEA